MKVDGSRAWKLTSLAVRALAVGRAPLGTRLRYAWTDHLMHLERPGVPWPDLADKYRDITDYFQLDPKAGALIIEGLGEDDQQQIAHEIVELHNEVCRRCSAEEGPSHRRP